MISPNYAKAWDHVLAKERARLRVLKWANRFIHSNSNWNLLHLRRACNDLDQCNRKSPIVNRKFPAN